MLNGFGDASAIDKLREGIAKEFGVRVTYDGADMSKPAEITRMVENATRTLGKVDILVSNAGIQHTALIEEFPAEKWDAIIAINLSATFHSIHAAHAADEAAQLGPHHQHRLRARPGRPRRRKSPMSRPSTAWSA